MPLVTCGPRPPKAWPRSNMEVEIPFNHITLGNVLEICTMVVLAVGFIYSMRGALQGLAQRMTAVETEIGKLTNILITLGKYEERFLRNESDIWDLKHGRGFVAEIPPNLRPRGRTGVVQSSDQGRQPSGDSEEP